jgi:hypothetical protein
MARSVGRPWALAGAAGVVLALSACVIDVGAPPGFAAFDVRDVNADGIILATAHNVPPPDGGPGFPVDTQVFVLDAQNTWRAVRPVMPDQFVDTVTAINGAGTIVGSGFVVSGPAPCPFVLPPGGEAQCVDDMSPDLQLVQPNDIDDAGVLVGFGNRFQPDGTLRGPLPLLWTPPGGTTALPLRPGDTWGQAEAINSRGQIVGEIGPSRTDPHAVLWCPPNYRPVVLAPDAAASAAVAIADNGVILGQTTDAAGVSTTTVWDASPAHRARTLPEGFALGLDGSGAPVGAVTRGGVTIAARFDPGTLAPQLLAPLDGRSSLAVAAAGGKIVGTVRDGTVTHAARFFPDPPQS